MAVLWELSGQTQSDQRQPGPVKWLAVFHRGRPKKAYGYDSF